MHQPPPKPDPNEFEDKTITVLDSVIDVQKVLARYKKKHWEVVHHSRPEGEPPSITLHLQRPKKGTKK